jgi:HD-like signal output (HDOD) protein
MLLGLVAVLIVALIGVTVWFAVPRRAPARAAFPKGVELGFPDSPPAAPKKPASTTPTAVARASADKPAKAAINLADTPAAAPEAKVVPLTPAPEIVPLNSTEIFARLHRVSFGPSADGEAWPANHEEVIVATAEALERASTDEKYMPRRPSLLPQLLRAVNDEEVSRRDLVKIISKDPSLVGTLLKMANSPFYRTSSQAIESIDRAVVVLGNDGIRSLIATALAQPIFQIRGGEFPKFPVIAWEHTFRTATATVTHAALVEKSDPFAAQLLGLVAGMAGTVTFRAALDQYEARPKLEPHAGVIASLLDMQSIAVAKRISTSWGLSDRIHAALDDQTTAVAADRQTSLGRSLSFGRVASALAVLHSNNAIDDVTAQISLPVAGMPATELQRLWTRLSSEDETVAPRKRPRPAAAAAAAR